MTLDIPPTADERFAWRMISMIGEPVIYRAAEGRQQKLQASDYHAATITAVNEDYTVNVRVMIDMNGSFDRERVSVFEGPLSKLPAGQCIVRR